ncbi:alcohol dehydrogenase [Colletotrichum truncatum]|uniref:Alcohol dehydrogenase n=1 Tax=Colletotrichum truncatum TaxID=5467 RepID=A0ACC3ZBL6_COLTU|nr:alcohol dehydrogenase [Colletotrichum truncatum]KAF6787815.1 alcohol dehydrogenase [Colletotrichum truncatum]
MTRSIYLSADGQLSVTEKPEDYVPQKSQALISVKYSGANHCDLTFFHFGLNSFTTGFEFAGIVESTGPESDLKVGDSVLGISPVCFPQPSSFGAHQDNAIVEDRLAYRVPAGLELKDAAAVAMGAHTAVDAIFNVLGFGLPAAGVTGADPTNHPIIIWGGASSVGVAAIKLAKVAGFNPIIVTASSKNHTALQDVGATHCFDYQSPTITEDIRATVRELGVTLSTGFDTVGKGVVIPDFDTEKTSPALLRKSLSEDVSADSLKLACTLPVRHDPAFGFCTSYRPPGDIGAMGHPQNPEFPIRTRKIMDYYLSAVERVPTHPNVVIVKGGEAGIKAIQKVASGGASFEKLVVEHPI